LTHGRDRTVSLLLKRMQVHQAAVVEMCVDEQDEIVEVGYPPSRSAVQVRPDHICPVFIALISQSHRRLLI